jgi:hypothetical protein
VSEMGRITNGVQLEALRDLWATDLSQSQIAKRLRTSANVVAGMVSRARKAGDPGFNRAERAGQAGHGRDGRGGGRAWTRRWTRVGQTGREKQAGREKQSGAARSGRRLPSVRFTAR